MSSVRTSGSHFPERFPTERQILSSVRSSQDLSQDLGIRDLYAYADKLQTPAQFALHHLLRYSKVECPQRDANATLLWTNFKRNPVFSHYLSSRLFFDQKITNPLEALRSFSAHEVGADTFLQPPPAVDKPKVVVLHGSELAENSKLGNINCGTKILEYDERIAFLREGDTVQFSREEFRLGHFLGAGNSTHIYALRDHPTQVLRIPYVVPRISAYLMTQHGLNPIEGARRLMLNHLSKRPDRDDVFVVSMTADNAGEFALADRVNGTLNGHDFLNHIEELIMKSPLNGFPLFRALELLGHYSELAKLKHLDAAIQYERRFLAPDRTPREIARQYVWDETGKAWVLVDWE